MLDRAEEYVPQFSCNTNIILGGIKMSLTKTLEQLIERAEKKGSAIKRVREASVMGNSYSWGMDVQAYREYVKSTPMINQWEVKRYVLSLETVEVYHYDTLIFKAENYGYWKMVYWYGQSNSDRDALNGLCSHFGINRSFRYLPSKDQFVEVAK
jgi:hypothetical protein